MIVERRLEVIGVLPRRAPPLDPRPQLGDDRVEVDLTADSWAFGCGILARIRWHGRESSAPSVAPASYAPALASYAVVNDRVPDPLPYGEIRAEIEAAAREAGAGDDFPPAYMSRGRVEPARFPRRTADPGDIRAAIALLEEQTNVHAAAPVDSRNRGISAAK